MSLKGDGPAAAAEVFDPAGKPVIAWAPYYSGGYFWNARWTGVSWETERAVPRDDLLTEHLGRWLVALQCFPQITMLGHQLTQLRAVAADRKGNVYILERGGHAQAGEECK